MSTISHEILTLIEYIKWLEYQIGYHNADYSYTTNLSKFKHFEEVNRLLGR
ncbi:MAG: hypothetical protein FWC41_11360 [Firmicutes bacterium]|nr:hypothetical protein [Bacillota bacterium]